MRPVLRPPLVPRLRVEPDGHPRVVVVGAAPRPMQVEWRAGAAAALADWIDASDCVVRMNDLKNAQARWIGRRNDVHVITNVGLPAERHARKRIGGGGVEVPREILFSVPAAEKAARLAVKGTRQTDDHVERRILDRQGWGEATAAAMPEATTRAMYEALGEHALGEVTASAGIRGIRWACHAERFRRWAVHALAFG